MPRIRNSDTYIDDFYFDDIHFGDLLFVYSKSEYTLESVSVSGRLHDNV